MSLQNQQHFADLVRFAIGGEVLGLRVKPITEESQDGQYVLPVFERHVCVQDVQGDRLCAIPSELVNELTTSGAEKSVFVNALAPNSIRSNPRISTRVHNVEYRGYVAFIHHVLEGLPQGTSVGFLAPAGLLSDHRCEALRSEIDEKHAIQWLIYTGGNWLPGLHPRFNLVILIVTVNRGPARLTRLVDLRGVESSRWLLEAKAAKKRGGGEVGRSIVLRGRRLGGSAWTYERWTKEFWESKSDSQELGSLRPLRELVDSIVVGLNSSHNPKAFHPIDENEGCPDGFAPIIGGREIKPEGLSIPGRFMAQIASVPEQAVVSEGDFLLRKIISHDPAGPKIIGAIVPPGIVGIIGNSVLRIRWKADFTPHARDLLIKWMLGEHASKALVALGISGVQLYPSTLLELEVPYPSETVVAALERLAEHEEWYRKRADTIAVTRQAIFSAARYREKVPLLLGTQQVEGERITAAKDSQKLEYRIRNYYPHPIALRRERLQVLDHGKSRLEECLDCAEHLVHFLALCALVQLGSLCPNENLPSRHLRSIVVKGNLRFSWGSSWSILNEAIDSTRNTDDPLATPIPQFLMLSDVCRMPDSRVVNAEIQLRRQRNNQSHLHRLPEPELVEVSKCMGIALDELLQAFGFLADIPLVHARDYSLDRYTGKRNAKFDVLRGSSVVFDRLELIVDEEIPRGDVGLIGRENVFYSLSPWLVFHCCDLCKRPETFLFSRCELQKATFVAMETGHSWENEKINALLGSILH